MGHGRRQPRARLRRRRAGAGNRNQILADLGLRHDPAPDQLPEEGRWPGGRRPARRAGAAETARTCAISARNVRSSVTGSITRTSSSKPTRKRERHLDESRTGRCGTTPRGFRPPRLPEEDGGGRARGSGPELEEQREPRQRVSPSRRSSPTLSLPSSHHPPPPPGVEVLYDEDDEQPAARRDAWRTGLQGEAEARRSCPYGDV
jgi:hypothetical protein